LIPITIACLFPELYSSNSFNFKPFDLISYNFCDLLRIVALSSDGVIEDFEEFSGFDKLGDSLSKPSLFSICFFNSSFENLLSF